MTPGMAAEGTTRRLPATPMLRSRAIEAGGAVIGIAVASVAGWHLMATDPRIEDLHGACFPSPEEAGRVAALVLARATGAA